MKEETLLLPKVEEEAVVKQMTHEEKLAVLSRFEITVHNNKLQQKEVESLLTKEGIKHYEFKSLCFHVPINIKYDELFVLRDMINQFSCSFVVFNIDHMSKNKIKNTKEIIEQLLEISIRYKNSYKVRIFYESGLYCYHYVTNDNLQTQESLGETIKEIHDVIDLIQKLTPDKIEQLQNEFDVEIIDNTSNEIRHQIKNSDLKLLILNSEALFKKYTYDNRRLECCFNFKNNKLRYEELLIDFNRIVQSFDVKLVFNLKSKTTKEFKNIDDITNNLIKNVPECNGLVKVVINPPNEKNEPMTCEILSKATYDYVCRFNNNNFKKHDSYDLYVPVKTKEIQDFINKNQAVNAKTKHQSMILDENELNELTKNINYAKKKSQIMEGKSNIMEEGFGEGDSERINALKEALVQKEEEYNKLMAEYTTLEGYYNQLEVSYRLLVTESEEEISTLKGEIVRFGMVYKVLESEFNILKETLTINNQTIKQLTQELEDTEEKLTRVKAEHEKTLQLYNGNAAQTQDDYNESQKRLQQLNEKLQQCNKELEKLTEENKAFSDRNQKLEQDLNANKEEHEQLAQKYITLEGGLEHRIIGFTAEITKLKEELKKQVPKDPQKPSFWSLRLAIEIIMSLAIIGLLIVVFAPVIKKKFGKNQHNTKNVV